MTNSILQSTGLIETLTPIFRNINEENWDQTKGRIYLNELDSVAPNAFHGKCCVCCHIALALRTTEDGRSCHDNETYADFLESLGPYSLLHESTEGEAYVFAQFKETYSNMDQFMLRAIFHCAGASRDPFSGEEWERMPSEVLERMKYIETLPPTDSRSNWPYAYWHIHDYYSREDVVLWLQKERDRIDSKIGSNTVLKEYTT